MKWKNQTDIIAPESELHSFHARNTDLCSLCGAWRGSLGLEPTPELYVQHLVEVFREVHRILKPSGTLWLNMGDSYAGSWGAVSHDLETKGKRMGTNARLGPSYPQNGLKPKDLCGIPWAVAFALRADGWYLRSDIIWAKPNPMPESVTDRPTKAHEYVFLLSKSPRYYFDQDAVREPNADPTRKHYGGGVGFAIPVQPNDSRALRNDGLLKYEFSEGRNIRSVWTIPTQPFKGAHFATFPERLVEPMIKAGCPAQVCRACGKPRERITQRDAEPEGMRNRSENTKMMFHSRQVGSGQKLQDWYDLHPSRTIDWSDCGCGVGFDSGVVLDPFIGSGTVAVVAKKLARHFLGIELSAEYVRMANERLRPYLEQTRLEVSA